MHNFQVLGGISMIIMGFFFCGTHFGATLFFFLMTTTFCVGNLIQFLANFRTANTGEMLAKSYYVNIRFLQPEAYIYQIFVILIGSNVQPFGYWNATSIIAKSVAGCNGTSKRILQVHMCSQSVHCSISKYLFIYSYI